jgi:hypothetical protein
MITNIKSNLRCFDQYVYDDYSLKDQKLDIKKYDPMVTKYRTLFVLENILTKEECHELIKLGEGKYESIKDEFTEKVRDCQRFLLMDDKLSKSIWQRVGKFVEEDRCTKGARPFGFGVEGDWKAKSINECFRFIKYPKGSKGFKPHRDACYVENENRRSIMTIIIYLNDNYENGYTVFHKPKIQRNKWNTVSEEMGKGSEEVFRYKPKAGSCIIFNHNMIHEGTEVIGGDKYIIRNDVIFEREEVDISHIYEDPDFEEAINLYREANNLETEGKVEEAGEYYERGLAYRQFNDDKNGY